MIVVTGLRSDIKPIMENHGVPVSLPKRREVIKPEPQTGVDKRVLDLVMTHGIASLDELTPSVRKNVLDFVEALIDAIKVNTTADVKHTLNHSKTLHHFFCLIMCCDHRPRRGTHDHRPRRGSELVVLMRKEATVENSRTMWRSFSIHKDFAHHVSL